MFAKMYHRRRLLGAASALMLVLSAGAIANTAGDASAGSKSPILIGGMAPLNAVVELPQIKFGEEAAVDSINASGGIDGHRLKIVVCDTQLTAAGELSCTRELIADKVVAVVDPAVFIDQSGAEIDLLQKAKIAYFGGGGDSTPNSRTLTRTFCRAGRLAQITAQLKRSRLPVRQR